MNYIARKIGQLYWGYPVYAALVILALLVTLIVVKRNFFYNVFYGPFEVSQDYVRSVKQVDDNLAISHVSFKGDSVYHSGFEMVIYANGAETNRNNMLFITLGDKLILVNRPRDWSMEDVHVSGDLFPIFKDEQEQIITPLVAKYPELKSKILPFSVLETKYQDQGKIVIGGFLFVVFGICFIGFARAIWKIGDSTPKNETGFYSNAG